MPVFHPGDELIRITLETYSLNIEFVSGTIEIEAPFLLTDAAGKTHELYPRTHDGNLRPLWDLIGENLREVALGMTAADTLIFRFQNDAIIAIPPHQERRGLIKGAVGDKLIMEDY